MLSLENGGNFKAKIYYVGTLYIIIIIIQLHVQYVHIINYICDLAA